MNKIKSLYVISLITLLPSTGYALDIDYDIAGYCHYQAKELGETIESCTEAEREAMGKVSVLPVDSSVMIPCEEEARKGGLRGSYVKLLNCINKQQGGSDYE